MYNLAMFNLHDYSIPVSIKLCDFYFSDESHLLNQLENVHGVVIHCSADENQNKVLELILSIKRRFILPIWVRSETKNVISKKLNLELGVLGNFDENVTNEEMFVIIENTLSLVHKKENEGNVETKMSNELLLNSLNFSIKAPGKAEVSLTRMEFKMISLLASRMNQAFTYEEIYKYIWEDEEDTDSASKRYRTSNLAFHIRNKLSKYSMNPKMLRTVRSVGYLLDSNLESDKLKEVIELTS
ncbi:winged helix-turn-helix domain-containing protein [Enterococcus sp. 5H]|uniref:winged helix-turn-helix domain-containing protein n=1 Tax=Enterococcus sp. 5H TaxID=1229490 RepID=UPI0023023FF7|nr:helix-turn-helix domain-containing protein [Enterococcus sp. 5H]MDA9471871.1 transcriptional regulator [Enterococcus sp. 5H]